MRFNTVLNSLQATVHQGKERKRCRNRTQLKTILVGDVKKYCRSLSQSLPPSLPLSGQRTCPVAYFVSLITHTAKPSLFSTTSLPSLHPFPSHINSSCCSASSFFCVPDFFQFSFPPPIPPYFSPHSLSTSSPSLLLSSFTSFLAGFPTPSLHPYFLQALLISFSLPSSCLPPISLLPSLSTSFTHPFLFPLLPACLPTYLTPSSLPLMYSMSNTSPLFLFPSIPHPFLFTHRFPT